METADAIQHFNKATGFVRLNMRGKYCLKTPLECDTTDLEKRQGVHVHRNYIINRIKDWWKKHLIDIPNDEWHIGHLDPTMNDALEKNIGYQLPIQAKYRNRFKFDDFFLKMWPTASELIPKMDNFYTNQEQRMIYEALRNKFTNP